jgi:hypothetical protein
MKSADDVRTSYDFYHREEGKTEIGVPAGYLVEKYGGREIYDEETDFRIVVEDIYHLKFEDLDLEDQHLALKFEWAWGVTDQPDITKTNNIKAYLFRPNQRKMWLAKETSPFYCGAFGAGKSLILWLKALRNCLYYPGTRGLYMRATYKQLDTASLPTLWKIFEYFGWRKEVHYTHNISRHSINILIDPSRDLKSEIIYMAAKNESGDIQEIIQDLQSLEIDFACLDEIATIDELIAQTVRSRIGRWGKITKPQDMQLLVAGNPPNEQSWIHMRWYKKQYKDGTPLGDPEEHAVFVSSTYENIRNLPKKYIRDLENAPGWFKNTFLYGQLGFVPPEGIPVYEKFNYNMYVKEEELKYNPELYMLRGWDLGPTHVNKTSVVAQLDSRGVLLVLAEFMLTDPGVIPFGQLVNEQCHIMFPLAKKWRDFADPVSFHISQTDGMSPASLLLKIGIQLIKGEESFINRIEAVRQVMSRIVDNGQPGLLIDKTRCPILVEGFLGGYRYNVLDSDNLRFSKGPVKDKFSHFHDALQYLCSRLGFIDYSEEHRSRIDRARHPRRNAELIKKREKFFRKGLPAL